MKLVSGWIGIESGLNKELFFSFTFSSVNKHIHIHTHTQVFLIYLIKAWERTTKKWDKEFGKHKINEMGALNMK